MNLRCMHAMTAHRIALNGDSITWCRECGKELSRLKANPEMEARRMGQNMFVWPLPPSGLSRQCRRVLLHLQTAFVIDPDDPYITQLGAAHWDPPILRLSERIRELEAKGFRIEHKRRYKGAAAGYRLIPQVPPAAPAVDYGATVEVKKADIARDDLKAVKGPLHIPELPEGAGISGYGEEDQT